MKQWSLKYQALKKALMYARGDSITDRSNMEFCLNQAQQNSSMPLAQGVIDRIIEEYEKHEPQRKYQALKKALMYARGDSITDRSNMEFWLNQEQQHSSMPLAQGVIDRIIEEYEKHEPQRKYQALKKALMYARGDSITDRSNMEFWLNQAQQHSPKVKDRIVTYIAGLGIKGIYALTHLRI